MKCNSIIICGREYICTHTHTFLHINTWSLTICVCHSSCSARRFSSVLILSSCLMASCLTLCMYVCMSFFKRLDFVFLPDGQPSYVLYVCMYVCMHKCMCIHHLWYCVSLSLHTYTHTCIYTHLQSRTVLHRTARADIWIYIYTYIYIHTHTPPKPNCIA